MVLDVPITLENYAVLVVILIGKIGYRDKFYRRLKAFLQHGIQIQSLVGTAFENMECEECRQWLSAAVKVYAGTDSREIKDKKITKLALMLTM